MNSFIYLFQPIAACTVTLYSILCILLLKLSYFDNRLFLWVRGKFQAIKLKSLCAIFIYYHSWNKTVTFISLKTLCCRIVASINCHLNVSSYLNWLWHDITSTSTCSNENFQQTGRTTLVVARYWSKFGKTVENDKIVAIMKSFFFEVIKINR